MALLRREFRLPKSKRLKIFVVDDEQIIAQTLAAILRHSGFSAEAFTNPGDALAAAALIAPDLLISDVMFSGQAAMGDLLRESLGNSSSGHVSERASQKR